MLEYQIRTLFNLPVVTVLIFGPQRTKKLQLLFDTGAAVTQFHIKTLESLGYSFQERVPDLVLRGVTGPAEQGYTISVSKFFTLGTRFENQVVAAFDLASCADEGIDGLLGFDLIRDFHLEMNGPIGVLKIYS